MFSWLTKRWPIKISWVRDTWLRFPYITKRNYYYGSPTRWYQRSNGTWTKGHNTTVIIIWRLNITIKHKKFYKTKNK